MVLFSLVTLLEHAVEHGVALGLQVPHGELVFESKVQRRVDVDVTGVAAIAAAPQHGAIGV